MGLGSRVQERDFTRRPETDGFVCAALLAETEAGSLGFFRVGVIDARIGLSPFRVTCFLFIIAVLDSCERFSVARGLFQDQRNRFRVRNRLFRGTESEK